MRTDDREPDFSATAVMGDNSFQEGFRLSQLQPANWSEGEEGMTTSAEGVSGYLARHFG
jgi:hypothetical protein